MRKGYRSADARPLFLEKEKVYCKLTVASAIQKGLLHVSFGTVRSRCRCALKKAFLYQLALYGLKKLSFPQTKSFPFIESFTNFTQSRFFTHKKFFCTCLSSLSAKISLFHKPKAFLSHKPFLIPTQSNSFLPSAAHFNHP